jgi:hypothetical protein
MAPIFQESGIVNSSLRSGSEQQACTTSESRRMDFVQTTSLLQQGGLI